MATPRPVKAAAVSVFRCGPVTVGQHTGEIADLYRLTDAVRPDDRPGRGNSIYASPTVFGVTRWVRGNHLVRRSSTEALVTRELRVQPDRVWVYDVSVWESATFTFDPDRISIDRLASYWETGIPLTDWVADAARLDLDPREWEALVPAEAIVSTRPVSNRRLVTSIPAGDGTRSALMSEIEPRRYRRGTVW